MNTTESLISLPLERNVLSGLLKHPEIFPEVDVHLNEFDFYHKVHRTIFCLIKSSYVKNEKLDKVVLSQKMQNLGISFEEIDPFTYIENLYYSQINASGGISSVKELINLRIKREIVQTAEKLKQHVITSGNVPIQELISTADAIYNNKISAYNLNEGPVKIFEDAGAILEEMGNNPVTTLGLEMPFPEYTRLYGGLRNKNLYAFVSRMGGGKSTLLNWVGFYMAKHHRIPYLMCDTEMSTEETRLRLMAGISGVPSYYIETGLWRKDVMMTTLVRKAIKEIESYPFYHFHVGNKSIEEIGSINRRWKYSVVGRDKQALICYDYFKLTSEKLGEGFNETQALGCKIDYFKRLLEELNVPGISAMQMNRTGESYNKKAGEFSDDSSAVATTDRLAWFTSGLMILRRKTLDELDQDGLAFGTHKGIIVKARQMGKDAPSHLDAMKRKMSPDDKKGQYVRNFINFQIDNFKVEERGSLRDIIAVETDKFNVQEASNDHTGL